MGGKTKQPKKKLTREGKAIGELQKTVGWEILTKHFEQLLKAKIEGFKAIDWKNPHHNKRMFTLDDINRLEIELLETFIETPEKLLARNTITKQPNDEELEQIAYDSMKYLEENI